MLWHLYAKLVGMPSSLGYLLVFSISGVLTQYIGTGPSTNLKLCLLCFPSNLNHPIWITKTQVMEFYIQTTLIFKTEADFFLAHSSPFEGFLGTLGLQFVYPSLK